MEEQKCEKDIEQDISGYGNVQCLGKFHTESSAAKKNG